MRGIFRDLRLIGGFITVCILGAIVMAAMSNHPEESTRRRPSSGHGPKPLSADEKATLAAGLTAEERRVILNQGTEPAFCGGLLNNKKSGTYVCRLCSLPLFQSKAKFESGTGWPSFYEPVEPDHIAYVDDNSYGMTRTEIRCARCDGHLGHVFNDGPRPTGERYCLNSVSLRFVEEDEAGK